MKIVQVHTGIHPIPPNGWGAVEKIIWEYKCCLEKLGHKCDVLYLNDIDPNRYDVVHVHLANLALELHERKIPYYFSFHDHHAYIYGKDSYIFDLNRKAMKHSIKSFVPAKYLVEYFDLPNVEYLSHGVNNSTFQPSNKLIDNHKLLCVANNGFIHNQSEDRKGFAYAIEAAKTLNLPITVAGPPNNRHFFESYNSDYDKLTILYNLSEKELSELYRKHTIFLHPSISEAGHPNLTLLEAMASGLPVVGTFEDNNELNGLCKITRDVNVIVNGVTDIINNYSDFRDRALKTAKEKDWNKIVENNLLLGYHMDDNVNMKDKLLKIYTETTIKHLPVRTGTNKILVDYNDGCKVEIVGSYSKKYKVRFIDNKNNNVIYESTISNNMWSKPIIKYFVDWRIEVTDLETNSCTIYNFNLNGKRVKIVNESGALGDGIAWIPCVDEFQKKHNCIVDYYSPLKELFQSEYENINFYNYNHVSNSEYFASYKIGCFDPEDRSTSAIDWRTQSLQQMTSNILGVDCLSTKPKFTMPTNLKNNFNKKYVCIGSLSTAQAKFWNNKDGWTKVVIYLNSLGYDVVSIDKGNNIGSGIYHNKIPEGTIDKTGELPLIERINDLHFCEFFIGLGSGLSWLAWMVNKPVILISGFSDPKSEFYTPYRVHNKNVCNSCWNDTSFKFDTGKWDWCPRNKDFECSSKITFEMVKEQIDKVIYRKNEHGY
jgi:autotransporter strand-loop-strand O-heptosyltransferase